MPEHLHLVLQPPDDLALGPVLGRMKGWTARQVLDSLSGLQKVPCRSDGKPAIWQRRGYDHNCRSLEIVREKVLYCHKNPIARGLVSGPSDWPWSSHNWYQKTGRVVLEIDGIEL